LDDIPNAGNRFRLRGVKGSDFAAKNRTPRDDCKKHAGHAGIDAESGHPGSFIAAFKTPRVVADDGEIVRVLEGNGVEIGDRKLGSGFDQFTVRQRALRMTVNHLSVLGSARVRTDFPLFGPRSDEHFASGGTRTAQRQPGAGDTAAPSCAQVIDFRIGGRLLDPHLLPIHAQFFREDHGKRRHDALAHFGFAKNQRDAIIRSDAHPGVEGIGRLLS